MNVFSALLGGMVVWSYPVSPADAKIPDYSATPLVQADVDLYLSTMHAAADAIAKAQATANADLAIANRNGVRLRYEAVRHEVEALVGPDVAAQGKDDAIQTADRQLLAPHQDEIMALQKQVRGSQQAGN